MPRLPVLTSRVCLLLGLVRLQQYACMLYEFA